MKSKIHFLNENFHFANINKIPAKMKTGKEKRAKVTVERKKEVERILARQHEVEAMLLSDQELDNEDEVVETSGERGVMYIGRIPHGFYEEEMKSYFGQFGQVTRLRLARNKKTGASKHYAFIEFAQREVAEIAAKTMHNYMMYGHVLQCHLVPSSQVHPSTFIGSDKKHVEIQENEAQPKKIEEPQDLEKLKSEDKERSLKKQQKLKELGINYVY